MSNPRKFKKPPFIKLDVQRFLSCKHYKRMNGEQRGWYFNMIMESWRSEKTCYLENSPEAIENAAGLDPTSDSPRHLAELTRFRDQEYSRIVRDRFKVTPDQTHIFNDTLIENFEDVLAARMKRQKAGMKGGMSKAGRISTLPLVPQPSNARTQASNAKQKEKEVEKEVEKEQELKPTPSVATAPVDSRHSRIREMVQGAWLEHNPGLPSCPWSGRAAKELQTLLKETPGWHDSHYAQCLVNVYASHGFPRGSPPHDYIRKLPKYMQGPLNEFGKAIIPGGRNGNGNSNKTEARTEHNLRVAREVASELGLTKEPPRVTGIDGGGDAGAVTILGRAEAVPR